MPKGKKAWEKNKYKTANNERILEGIYNTTPDTYIHNQRQFESMLESNNIAGELFDDDHTNMHYALSIDELLERPQKSFNPSSSFTDHAMMNSCLRDILSENKSSIIFFLNTSPNTKELCFDKAYNKMIGQGVDKAYNIKETKEARLVIRKTKDGGINGTFYPVVKNGIGKIIDNALINGSVNGETPLSMYLRTLINSNTYTNTSVELRYMCDKDNEYIIYKNVLSYENNPDKKVFEIKFNDSGIKDIKTWELKRDKSNEERKVNEKNYALQQFLQVKKSGNRYKAVIKLIEDFHKFKEAPENQEILDMCTDYKSSRYYLNYRRTHKPETLDNQIKRLRGEIDRERLMTTEPERFFQENII